MADVDITQAETITVTDNAGSQVPILRVTQVGVEYADAQSATARVSHVGVEYGDTQSATARVSQMGLEYAGPRIIATLIDAVRPRIRAAVYRAGLGAGRQFWPARLG